MSDENELKDDRDVETFVALDIDGPGLIPIQAEIRSLGSGRRWFSVLIPKPDRRYKVHFWFQDNNDSNIQETFPNVSVYATTRKTWVRNVGGMRSETNAEWTTIPDRIGNWHNADFASRREYTMPPEDGNEDRVYTFQFNQWWNRRGKPDSLPLIRAGRNYDDPRPIRIRIDPTGLIGATVICRWDDNHDGKITVCSRIEVA